MRPAVFPAVFNGIALQDGRNARRAGPCRRRAETRPAAGWLHKYSDRPANLMAQYQRRRRGQRNHNQVQNCVSRPIRGLNRHGFLGI